ncbi:uncharacterized protein EV154DRAFT_479743 [Mucor mucedo]|uniref:uncharacterized protein n=1 Tax=Mucor mucedo TaxID=29922 RepID=UPI00221FADB5|nr:uncharacterized protein EV154DRAFT_479743 [Mucor mucedo]KAI7893072.1 hypothetical protein EV154DRAFT_479743 [Mucor mucedo]
MWYHEKSIDRTGKVEYPLKDTSNIILYGEKLDETLFVYAHPLMDDFDFLGIYESGTTLYPPNEDRNHDQMVLDEVFGNAFDYEDMISSAQLPRPANALSELDLINKIAHTMHDPVASRDLISEAKNAMEEKKLLMKNKHLPVVTQSRMPKSKPSKYKAPVNINIPYEKLTLEKKNIIKNLIKETLTSPAKENKNINQLIYSSIRFVYRNIMTSSKPIDEAKLKCIIQMHADFYTNVENVVQLFHPQEYSPRPDDNQ